MKKFADLIRVELARQGTNPYRAARDAGLPDNAIRYVLDGKKPKMDRVFEICHALGFDINIVKQDIPEKAVFADNKQVSANETGVLDVPVRDLPPDHVDTEYLIAPELDVRLAVGEGADLGDEFVGQGIAFRRDWMRRHGLQSGQVSAVEVTGDSMLPTLTDGAIVLVDHRHQEYIRRGTIVVARLADSDLVVRRWSQMKTGDRLLIPDNIEYDYIPFTDADEVIGTVVWKGVWL